MIDPFGRTISYLRVSVTDRCDFRCVYCMAEDMTFLPKVEILSLEELDRLCSAFVRQGVRKLRLTGGEPLVRKNVMSLVRNLARHLDSGALDDLTLTTNGSQLVRYAGELAACGVRRINVSIDTLDPRKFTAITRWGRLDQVFEGLAAAKAAGLAIKINAVALKGVNEQEFDGLIEWCGKEGFDLTLIEVMPMGDIGGENRVDQYLPLSLVRARLAQRWTLEDIDYRSGGPARYVRIAETGRRLGFITQLP
jgi:cyclic pyranopterin phosphate synthase